MIALIQRDIRLALRSGGSWAFGLAFFVLFLSLCAIALGGSMSDLGPLGGPLCVLAFALAAMMSSGSVFSEDLSDGTLEQARLSGLGWVELAAAKWFSVIIITLLPLLISLPLGALLFGLTADQITGLVLSLALALPGLAGFVCVAGALTAGQGRGGLLGILIAAPLLLPLLIFAIAASEQYVISGLGAVELRFLAGISLLGLVTALPATAAALFVQTD